MSYDTIIEQVKTLPEPLLASVSAFIKLLEAEQHKDISVRTAPKSKQAFLDLAGKIHLASDAVMELREASLL